MEHGIPASLSGIRRNRHVPELGKKGIKSVPQGIEIGQVQWVIKRAAELAHMGIQRFDMSQLSLEC
jgi:hypothetical protein